MRLVLLIGVLLSVACATNTQNTTPPSQLPVIERRAPYFLTVMSISCVAGNTQELRQELLLRFLYDGSAPLLWAQNTVAEDKRSMTLEFTNASIHPGFLKGYLEHTENAIIHRIMVHPSLRALTVEFNYPVELKTYTIGNGVVGFIYFFQKQPELLL